MSVLNRFHNLFRNFTLLTCATLFLSACASKPPASDPEALQAFEELNDPLEPWNRAMHQLDQGLDTVIFNPTIAVYETIIPEPGRQGVTNALRNFRSPITLANDLLQGEGERAGITLGRFVVNSTVGVLGLFDVAQHWGMPYHSEDFGQTLAVWGVEEGPFFYVPILGPSNFRDVTGYAVDTTGIDAMAWITRADNPFWWQLAYTGVLTVDLKATAKPFLEDLEASSIDYYAALRAAYRQNRAQAIRNGAPAPLPDLNEFDEDGGDPFAKNKSGEEKQVAQELLR